jgi:RimJ/RimL family protein N-acetyltransferase
MTAIEKKCAIEIKLRPAVYGDVHVVLSWRNEPTTLMNMRTKRSLSFEEHETWFKRSITGANCIFLIIEVDSEPVGQLRYELENSMAKVSINVTRDWHGKGVASRAFYLGSRHVKRVNFAENIFARVLKTNVGSIRAMEKAGFNIVKELIYSGEQHYYMVHELKNI